ncbi:MAG: hypothetical protein HY231_26880 [Acidobacteria bacterium]|nr:hypothetical protein [Acidobacteriota bacterium]
MTIHEKILEYLAPVLGEATAKNLLRHYCIKMHLSFEEITPKNLPELASAMRPMMAVWLGSSGAERASQEIANLAQGVYTK